MGHYPQMHVFFKTPREVRVSHFSIFSTKKHHLLVDTLNDLGSNPERAHNHLRTDPEQKEQSNNTPSGRWINNRRKAYF